MSDNSNSHPFNEEYFHSNAYARVDFQKKYTQYWWSNRFYARLARKYGPSSGKVLEIGCGLGHLLTWLAVPDVGQAVRLSTNSRTPAYDVFGTDINEWALGQARQLLPQGHFQLCPAEDLSPFSDASFQIVIAKHVVEHLPQPELAIAEISRVLAPGGLLLLATPNFDSPMRLWKKERWIGFQDPTHISLLPPAEWLDLLKRHHLKPRKVFSDGFWDAPYLPLLPARLQKLFFGAPGGLQAILGWSFLPLWLGESLIAIAHKQPTS